MLIRRISKFHVVDPRTGANIRFFNWGWRVCAHRPAGGLGHAPNPLCGIGWLRAGREKFKEKAKKCWTCL